jgi:chromate transporter
LLVAGIAFIAPATAIVTLLSWAYVRFGTLPAIHGALYGIKPVMIGIIAQALWTLGRYCLRTRQLVGICLVDIVAIAYGMHELVILFGTGLASCLIASAVRKSSFTFAFLPFPLNFQPCVALAQPMTPQSFSPDSLFLVFLKIGSVLFGSGYVLFAYMKADFVDRLGWMTDRQLLDAVTIGQITPGPLFTSATFVGYLMAGPIGGLVATVGIFLPSFVFVALSAPLVPRMRRSTMAAAFLDGVNVASWVLMAAVTFTMGRESLVDALTVLLALLSLGLMTIWRVNSTWLVAIGALSGIATTLY